MVILSPENNTDNNRPIVRRPVQSTANKGYIISWTAIEYDTIRKQWLCGSFVQIEWLIIESSRNFPYITPFCPPDSELLFCISPIFLLKFRRQNDLTV